MKDYKLSKTVVYESVLTPDRGFNIDREKVKKDAIHGYLESKRKNNLKDSVQYKDYEFKYVSQETILLNIFIRDEFFVQTKEKIVLDDKYINVMEHLEQSYLRNNVDVTCYERSTWYTCIYCCDVTEDSSELIIQYDNNIDKENIVKFKIENNKIFVFPSTLKYFFSENLSTDPNIFITFTYKIIEKIGPRA